MQEKPLNRIVFLITLSQQGAIGAAEQQELDEWAGRSATNRRFIDRCFDQDEVKTSLAQMDRVDEDAAWQQFVNRIQQRDEQDSLVVPIHKKRPFSWVAAAAVTGALAIGAWWFFARQHQPAPQQVVIVDKPTDIQPASKKATLTLGDGRVIPLDGAQDGVVAKEDGAEVNKQGDELIYDRPGKKESRPEAVRFHSVSTPVGGFYTLVLPDKTKAWLNADSRLTYPTVFTGKERKVEMVGEVYFEVAKDAAHPFVVSTGKAEVEVLGTHFNVRSYPDEATIKATLLEGSVQVTATEGRKPEVTLKPGQQAAVSINGPAANIPVKEVEMAAVVAWKNGYFDFRAATLGDIMKEVKRWYAGIDAIEMMGRNVEGKFTAEIPRDISFSTMLRVLQETTGAKIEYKDRKIVITQ